MATQIHCRTHWQIDSWLLISGETRTFIYCVLSCSDDLQPSTLVLHLSPSGTYMVTQKKHTESKYPKQHMYIILPQGLAVYMVRVRSTLYKLIGLSYTEHSGTILTQQKTNKQCALIILLIACMLLKATFPSLFPSKDGRGSKISAKGIFSCMHNRPSTSFANIGVCNCRGRKLCIVN